MTANAVCFLIIFASTLILGAAFTRFLIPVLKSKKMGQKILDIGPRWHKSKEGTPTMGGLAFIASFVAVIACAMIVSLALGREINLAWVYTCIFALLCATIGFIDDYTKFFKNQNEGLLAWQKYLLQVVAAGLYLAALKSGGFISTKLYIPYISLELELGVLYYIIALILITGMVNSVNLTDGIDGLAASQTLVVAAFFAIASCVVNSLDGVAVSAALGGACAGFLVYNFHPAKVFMGDTGSLFLGGMVVGAAFSLGNPLIVVVCGIIYVCESCSVILQVASFKLTGKRIFKMSPIHHHFEKCGWNENKIVGVFSTVTVIACVLAYLGLA